MKKVTIIMLAASLVWVSACEDKEEEVFDKVSKDIESVKHREIESDDVDEGP